MKWLPVLGVAAGVALTGCEDLSRPLSAGSFDPLGTPGAGTASTPPVAGYLPGQFVRAMMDNTAFFLKKPSGDADADKLLPRGASMKVIQNVDTYVKVELDTGEVGLVPAIMVEDPNAVPTMDLANPNEFLLYPPQEGYDALPSVPQGERPPEGAIPTVIDPNAPASSTSAPAVDILPLLPPAGAETPAPAGAAPGAAEGASPVTEATPPAAPATVPAVDPATPPASE